MLQPTVSSPRCQFSKVKKPGINRTSLRDLQFGDSSGQSLEGRRWRAQWEWHLLQIHTTQSLPKSLTRAPQQREHTDPGWVHPADVSAGCELSRTGPPVVRRPGRVGLRLGNSASDVCAGEQPPLQNHKTQCLSKSPTEVPKKKEHHRSRLGAADFSAEHGLSSTGSPGVGWMELVAYVLGGMAPALEPYNSVSL